MWRILALDRFTKRIVEVAIAMCEAEREMILDEEAKNYMAVWSVRLDVARGAA